MKARKFFQKSESIINFLEELVPDTKVNIRHGRCPSCRAIITKDSFKDKISLEEFHISGLCQKCQDAVFSTAKD